MKTKLIIRQLKKRMAVLAEERDKLDDLIDDATDLKENCECAYQSLQEAVDKLSELV